MKPTVLLWVHVQTVAFKAKCEGLVKGSFHRKANVSMHTPVCVQILLMPNPSSAQRAFRVTSDVASQTFLGWLAVSCLCVHVLCKHLLQTHLHGQQDSTDICALRSCIGCLLVRPAEYVAEIHKVDLDI